MNFGFAVAFAFLAIISIYSYINTNLLVKNIESVVHTHAVKQAIEKVISEMKDMETGQRGYIITGNEDYLDPYNEALLSIEQTLDRLQQLTFDNATQQDFIKEFRTLKGQKIERMKESVRLRKDIGFEAAQKNLLDNSGKNTMDKMREIVKQMHGEEDRLLNNRSSEADGSTRTTMAVIIVGGLISLFIIFGALIILNRAETERLATDRKLEGQNRIRAGLIELSEKMSGEQSIAMLAKNVIEKIADFINAKVGALYLADEAGMLKYVGGYAYQPSGGVTADFKPGEGLVGQAALQKKPLSVSDVPETYFKVSSGLGTSMPKVIHVVPFMHEGVVRGVAELGAFSSFSDEHMQFLNLTLERIAVAFNSAQARVKMTELLQETQAQAEELQSQQEELRVTNEELGEKTRELEAQQEELRQANEELEEQRAGLEEKSAEVLRMSQYKSEFLANMSHELRTPLNSQLILSQMLAENSEGNLTEKQKEFAQTIHSTGLDLLQLINDILDLSKVEAGKLDLDMRDFSFADVVDDWDRIFRPLVEKKKLKFKVDIDPLVSRSLYSDSHRLSQIIKNFLSNSLKFTSSGEVRLHIGQATKTELAQAQIKEAQFLAFRVIDTGIGVPADKMEKIFQAFEQVDSSISRQYGGTGLGLAICKKLAHLLGGAVVASSEVGKGSVFTLLIPQGNAAPVALTSPVLIIDDNAVLAKAFALLVKKQGYQVHIAGTGGEGLKYIQEHEPMGVLLDSHLPDMNGLDVLKQIKSNPTKSHIPVYLVSGEPLETDIEKAGALGFLLKPASSDDLMKALEKMRQVSKTKKNRILVVDDVEIHLNHMVQLLTSDKVTVVSARTAEEAMRILESQGLFDCIVLDLRLPDMSGFDMLEKLNQQKNRIPTIIYTATELNKSQEIRLRQYSQNIIVKGDRSGERLVDEVNLLLRKGNTVAPAKVNKSDELFGAEAAFKGKHILIADDDDRNVFALTNALQTKGLKVSYVHNGQEALNALEGRSSAVDLVLMDVMMPVMDGLEATRHIRKKTIGGEIPIIVLSAKAMRGSREACIEAGANDYLSKPVDMERLLALLRVWLAKK